MLGQAAPRLAKWRLARLRLDPAIVRQLAAALLAAALLEVVLLRLVTRVGVYLPREEAVNSGFEAASFLGSLAFNFASILATILIVLLLGSMVLRMQNQVARLLVAALSVLMLWGLGWSLATGALAADALFGFAMTLLVVLVGIVLVSQRETTLAGRLALGLIVAAYVCYQYYTLGYLTVRLLDYAAVPPLSIATLRLGEGFVVVSGGAAFWAWGAGRWRSAGPAGMALVAALVLAVAFGSLAPASTTSILALWTTGMSFFFPLPVYLLSLALYLLTVVACLRSGDASSSWIGAGLLLLLIAGYMPEATYHHLLILLGVAFLSGAAQLGSGIGTRLQASELRAGAGS
ncbi:MAG: hypothetical protein IIC88_00945 [Chloroflexi bacterium]|nr:hypothetical protein [Chloroflexota bacterium]